MAPLLAKLDELLRLPQIPETPPSQAPEEQRKLVSVLCADLVGFTALSGQLDPEDLREIQQAYFATVTPPIKERGGVVEKYIGDAVLAVFGLPQAQEDDPERAVRAALEMLSALARLNQRQQGETGFPLQMRVGVSTGMVPGDLQARSGRLCGDRRSGQPGLPTSGIGAAGWGAHPARYLPPPARRLRRAGFGSGRGEGSCRASDSLPGAAPQAARLPPGRARSRGHRDTSDGAPG